MEKHEPLPGVERTLTGWFKVFPESLNNCETQSIALRMLVILRLIVFLKYAWNVFSRYAYTAVPDLDTDLIPSATTANQNLSSLSVAHRV